MEGGNLLELFGVPTAYPESVSESDTGGHDSNDDLPDFVYVLNRSERVCTEESTDGVFE